MVSQKKVMFIGVLIGGMMRSSIRSSEDAKGESEMYKEGLISLILGSGDVAPVW